MNKKESKFSSVCNYTWEFLKSDDKNTESISDKTNLPYQIAKILDQKGYNSNTCEQFLNPKIKNDLTNPYPLKDIEKASKRIAKAIEDNEKIGIFGDYDVDGATSSATIYNYIKSINPEQQIEIHIPDREKEGYGLNTPALTKLHNNGASLIITVDCGISNTEEIKETNSEIPNCDIIITDHHNQGGELPPAYAVVNPKRIDETNQDLGILAGVGVAFLTCIATNHTLTQNKFFKTKNIEKPNLINLLDITALGTVCDSVPLKGINRSIISTGFKIIDKNQNTGIKLLSEIAQAPAKSSVYSLGFILGPRINAGGRIGDSSIGANLLTGTNPLIVENYAKKLQTLNEERKAIEVNILEEAQNQITNEMLKKQYIFVKSNHWHKGIIGIVASKLKEQHNLPVFISTKTKDGYFTGSGRSANSFDLGATIINGANQKILLKGGGHKMAAGYSYDESEEENFKSLIEKNIAEYLRKDDFQKIIKISSIIDLKAVSTNLLERIESLSPFGIGNPEPRFAISNARLTSYTPLKNGVVKIILSSDSGGSITGIMFSSTPCKIKEVLEHGIGKNFLAIGKLQISEFKGRKTNQIMVEDIGI